MYDFLFVIIELFSLALTVETLQAEIAASRGKNKNSSVDETVKVNIFTTSYM